MLFVLISPTFDNTVLIFNCSSTILWTLYICPKNENKRKNNNTILKFLGIKKHHFDQYITVKYESVQAFL